MQDHLGQPLPGIVQGGNRQQQALMQLPALAGSQDKATTSRFAARLTHMPGMVTAFDRGMPHLYHASELVPMLLLLCGGSVGRPC